MKNDFQIHKDVTDEIEWDPQLAKIASRIRITVKNEVVTLAGDVEYHAQKLAAEQAAKRVRDVKVVVVDIVVKRAAASNGMTDSQIGEAVRNALRWHSAVNEDAINIIVEDGFVYLEGVVDWDYQRKAAANAIGNLQGIKGVINNVKIRESKIEPTEIKKKIKTAFQRHASVDAANINVDAVGGTVILKGMVRSWAERKDAEHVAWSMLGVTNVDNKLEIRDMFVAD